MNARFAVAVGVVSIAVGMLVYTAVRQTAKPVVTVHELVNEHRTRSNVRLGARVAERPISVEQGTVLFSVHDISKDLPAEKLISIAYVGALPDTLRSGRDVILEGDFDPSIQRFSARVLQTQCPSKYVPPSGAAGVGASAQGEQ